MNKVIEYIIGAKDKTANAIKSALSRIKSFAATVGSNLQNIRAGFAMLGTAAQKAVSFLQKAFAFEKMTVQFKTLIGSMDEARDHMKMLQELGDTPPFSLEEFAGASRALMVMSDGVLGFRKSLEMVGDAAAATGQPIESLAHEVGRAYAIIRDGQPLTRATMALRNMGVLTPEVAQKLDDLQKSGASTNEIWKEMEKALSRYNGAMAETEQTGEGLMGAISAQWDDTLREFGAACLETSKDALGGLLDWMKKLREDGSIAVWANKFGRAMEKVAEAAKTAGKWISKVVDGYMALRNWMEEKGSAIGGFVGTVAAGGSLKDAKQAASDAAAQTRQEQKDRAREEAESDERARKTGQERAKKAAADAAQKKLEEEKKIQEALAEGQRKIDKRNAEEAAKKRAEADKKAAEEAAKAQKKIDEEMAKARERELKNYMATCKKDLSEWQREEQSANARLQKAQEESSKAWGWYRNRDSWKAQLQEERDNAAAEKQFEKDAASLKKKTNWRNRTLNDDDEIVRRVVLAREEEQAAQDYARQTAEYTKQCADALDSVVRALGEGEVE